MVHLPAYLIFRILLSTVTLFPIGLALFYARMLDRFAPRINALNVHEWIEYQGLENYAAAKKQGRGILIATAHLGTGNSAPLPTPS